MKSMAMQHPGGWVEVPQEGFTLAQLDATPRVPPGAVRSRCRWLGLSWLVLQLVTFVGVVIAEILY